MHAPDAAISRNVREKMMRENKKRSEETIIERKRENKKKYEAIRRDQKRSQVRRN